MIYKSWKYKIEGEFKSNVTAEQIANATVYMCKQNGMSIPKIILESNDRIIEFTFKDSYEVK